MRGVLVDDHHAVAGLRDDVIVVQLRARRAERRVKRLRVDGRGVRARVGRRRLVQEARRAALRRSPRLQGAAGEARQSQFPGCDRRHRDRATDGACALRAAMSPRPPAPVRGARCIAPRQRLLQRADDEAAHEAGIAEAHFGLGGMHVHVHLARIEFDEQRERGMPVAGQIIHVGAAHGAVQQLVAHRPAVDEEILLRARWRDARSAGPRSPCRRTPSRSASTRSALSRNSAPIACAQPRGEAFGGVRRRGGVQSKPERLSPASANRTCGFAIASRRTTSATACASARGLLRNLRRAGVAEKRSRTSTRVPNGCGRGRDGVLAPLIDANAMRLRARPRGRETMSRRGDRADGGQRLAAKAERRDAREVAVRNLRGRVAIDGKREIGGVHARAVVDDADELAAAVLDGDVDAARAGIERVLDEFLDRGRGALDHLAGGDAVDENGIETANGHGRGLRESGQDCTWTLCAAAADHKPA